MVSVDVAFWGHTTLDIKIQQKLSSEFLIGLKFLSNHSKHLRIYIFTVW